ncbi:LA_0442/LA_0875 N-terminal domain-containing protein [Leptospira wolffii]|uniref:LA_0442/LA_0875 N-terminal domain-containing protein n=1 Tax=Leptospira wolffii TaxID=409998 RepID=A0ABV5BKH8_9LEPT
MIGLLHRTFQILLFFAIFLAPGFLFAEQTILLRKGGKLMGNITGQNEKAITVQTAEGTKTIGKREILKIIYKDVTKEEENRIRKEEEKKLQENPKIEEPLVIAPPPEVKTSSRSKWSVVWRSALLPGWGAWYAGRKKEGGLTAAGFATTLGLASYARVEAGSAKKDYDEAVFRSSVQGAYIFGGAISNFYLYAVVPEARSKYDSSIHTYNGAVYLLASAYLAQLVRSYFIGKSWEQETEPNPISWGVYPKPDLMLGKLGWGAEASIQIGF